jgi:Fe2+ or Zn2+ uptake regulation protein
VKSYLIEKKTFHFTINDLAKSISKQLNEKISLATVYNTVHAFKDKGYLKKFQLIVIKVILIQISLITTIF